MRRLISIAAILCVIAQPIPATASQEVIVDNPSATFVGSWTTATSATDKYGADYRYCNQSTSGSNTATYTPNIPTTASDWQVYTWYPTVSTSSTATQFKIQHALGETTVTISQSANRGVWVLLGTYTMNAGTGNYARITNYHASSTRRAIADGMRFYSATAGDTTPPVITNVAQTHGATYAVITWTTDEPATSQVEYGLTNGYGSQTTEDATLVLSHSVQITGLTPETLYHYCVKSKDAANNLRTSGDYTLTTSALVAEYRAVWANTWNSGILGSSQIATAVNVTSGANFNIFIPEVRKCGDAYYNFSPVYCEACKANHTEPRATNIVDAYPYDPLQDMITKFHALDMKVFGWMVAYRIWNSGWGAAPANHVWAVHPDWVMKSNTGAILDGTNYNLDPGIPAVQDYICKVAVSLVSHYDVDGINWDYIRYPGLYWGYNEITKQRYYDEYGYYPPTVNTDPNWLAWCDYRRQQVSDLLKKVQLETMAVKPLINHTVCTVGWSGADPNTNFAGTRQYSEVFQDTENWMDDHIIDTNILMNYKREYDVAQGPDYDLWTTWLATTQASSGRHSMDGQACYLNSITDSIHQMQVARTAGVGINNYDYITTNKDAAPATDFFNAVKAGIYQDPAPVPDMPWKTAPTTGVIFGTVTDASKPNDSIYLNWVYKATVQVTGPVTESTLTDATGTYGFMDLPPGTYTITVSKTGFSPRSYTAQTVNAGDVVREDFDLGIITHSSVVGAVSTGWTLFSLPLEPVNPDPAVVLAGTRVDGYLIRWDNPSQSQYMYDVWNPSIFGNLNTSEGYWLMADSPYTFSYQAFAGCAAMRDVPLPSAGWAIVGCPFLTNAKWEDIMVTNGGTTVGMRTAAKTNNWLSAFGFWWDSASQSQYDIGLPEDWPSATEMQPWHGYWVNTYVNDLTLRLRQAKE